MTWDEWDNIQAAQEAADAQAEARQRERIARSEARRAEPPDIIAEAEEVAASEVGRLAAEGRDHIQALSSTAPPPPSPPGTVAALRSPLSGLRLHLAKMRAAIDTGRNEP